MLHKNTDHCFPLLSSQPKITSIIEQLFECLKFKHNNHDILNKAINCIIKDVDINNIDTWNQYYKYFHNDFKQKITHKYEYFSRKY